MTRLLVLFGSGETTPAFVTLHRELFARHGELTSASAVMLDTTYGFQTNADELTARLRGYFADSAGVDVGEVRLRSSNAGPGAVATAVDTVSTARWVFAGPGSPTYTARNWLATGMERAFTRVLEQGSLVFASAAAMSLGSHVMPVYEIYRVGQDPHWQPGLDVIGAALGVKAAVVAHYDNTEGGTHDTRYCFAGADRFATLEAQLPADTGVIGVDEHTAVVIDLDEESVAVHGRGGLTLRSPCPRRSPAHLLFRRDGQQVRVRRRMPRTPALVPRGATTRNSPGAEGLRPSDERSNQLAFDTPERGWREADEAADRATARFGAGAVKPARLVRPDE